MDLRKQDLLTEVTELLASHEQAIEHRPPLTVEVYGKGREAFINGQRTAVEEPWMGAAGVTLEELTLLRRFMLSSSFMSAWYHLHSDKARRDKAANSCVMIVAGFGEDPEQVMQRYIEYERHWRGVIKAEGIVPSRWRTASAFALVYPLIAGLWMSGRAPLMEATGYGVTQLGYVVGFGSLVFGSFRVLGIGSRWLGLAVGVVFWLLGVVMVNL